MKTLLVVLTLFVWFSAFPQGVDRQDVEMLNRSLQNLGESARERRLDEINRRLDEERIKYLQALREKEARATNSVLVVPEGGTPAAPRFQILTSVVSSGEKDSTLVLRMDAKTGDTWELKRTKSGEAYWAKILVETHTADECESAAKTFDDAGKSDLGKLARERAKELRTSQIESTNAPSRK